MYFSYPILSYVYKFFSKHISFATQFVSLDILDLLQFKLKTYYDNTPRALPAQVRSSLYVERAGETLLGE